MAFKLTYSDGQESQHGDDTVWELDDGVLKLGREKGKWSVLLSPSHWAVLELGGESKDADAGSNKKDKGGNADKKDADKKDEGRDADSDSDKKDAEEKDAAKNDSDDD